LVRYADDFVVLCRAKEQAEEVLTLVRHWSEEAGLQLHPQKTRLVDMSEPGGFDFLVITLNASVVGRGKRAGSDWSTNSMG
jgi:hypothetical protein